jgi:DNA-binding response OmpR family regulator
MPSSDSNIGALKGAPASAAPGMGAAAPHDPARLSAKPLAPAASAAGESSQRRPLRLAILDRDSGFVAVLLKRMERAGWESSLVASDISPESLASMAIDVLIVDVDAVARRRWSWLGEVCERRPDLSVVVCSRSSSVSQRVVSLRLGVDDWLIKPCHPEELIARVEAATGHARRRHKRNLEPAAVGEIEIRPDQYQAFVAGRSLRLTLREYQMLELLARGGSDVQRRELIFEALWGREMSRNERSVDVCVHKLRRKLELGSQGWRYIHTHYGMGYRLAAEPAVSGSVHELHADDDEPAATSLAA